MKTFKKIYGWLMLMFIIALQNFPQFFKQPTVSDWLSIIAMLIASSIMLGDD